MVLPDGSTIAVVPAETPLPFPENRHPIDARNVTLQRMNGSWQVWAGQSVFKDLGNNETNAKDVVRILRDLRPTEWVGIGSPHPVVEYGLINGRPTAPTGFPPAVMPVDLRTVRVEPVKGVWCVRDDANILFNFGLNKPDADQTLAVVRRYGFNRIGMIGPSAAPALTYFYVGIEATGAAPAVHNPLVFAAQENALVRTGIPVPGVGYIGEMVRIDPRKVEARKEGIDWVVACGSEVLGRFGPTGEATAREASRIVRDARFTEFCRVGTHGLTFFLVDGNAPTWVPFSAQGRRFDLNALKTTSIGARWMVSDNGHYLFDVNGPEEGDAIIRLLKHFRFDQLCQVGSSPRTSLTFLGRTR